jgi:hypothetical protein
MVKSCPGERLKRSILVHILLNKEPSLVAGQCQQLLAGTGILQNPEDSGVTTGIPALPTGIPAKNSCKNGKTRNSCDPLQNHVPVKNTSGKRRKKRIPQESCQERFFGSKK